MKLEIYKENSSARIPRKNIMLLFNKIYSKEVGPKKVGLVNLIFTDDTDLKKMNKQYRKKNKPTDVLSFNYDEPTTQDDIFGEIYISVEKALKQAIEYEWTISDELMRLTCHGLLHLLGYDHENEKDADVMKAKEELYLERIK